MWECSGPQSVSKPRTSIATASSVGVMEYSVKNIEAPNFIPFSGQDGQDGNAGPSRLNYRPRSQPPEGIGFCREPAIQNSYLTEPIRLKNEHLPGSTGYQLHV